MFERYTERARRVIFFARYEVSQVGGAALETEHLLLGLMREPRVSASMFFTNSALSMEQVRRDVEDRSPDRAKVSTSVAIPLSLETKRVLCHALEEAHRLLHDYVGVQHLLLGLMREERSTAAIILAEKGLQLPDARQEVQALLDPKAVRLTADDVTSIAATPGPERFELTAIDRRFLRSLKIGVDDA